MDFGDYVRFVFALAFVLGLIGLATVALKRFGMLPRVTRRKTGSGKRLGIVEIAPIDAKRRLILVRRDDVEHLIVLGTSSELLVESGIPARSEVTARDGASPKGDDTLAAAEPSLSRAIPETSTEELHP